MLKRLWHNFKKDWLRGHRHFYLVITIATTLTYFLFIRFVIPVDYMAPNLYQYNATDMEIVEEEGVTEVNSRAELEELMKENGNSYGVIVEEIDSKLTLTIITQSAADEEFASLIKLLINNEFYFEYFGDELFEYYDVEVLHPEMADVDFRDNFVPVLIVMDSAMVGMFLLSVMLFIEKDQKMHTAYLVSPGGLTEHLLSKTLVMIVLAVVSAFVLTLLMRGFEANYWYLLIMMITSSFFGASLGTFMGSAFKSVSQAMGGIFTVMITLCLPVVSYIIPSWNPEFLQYIPTYYMIYGIRAAVIPFYGFEIVWQSALIVFAFGLVIYIISQNLYKRALYRNG